MNTKKLHLLMIEEAKQALIRNRYSKYKELWLMCRNLVSEGDDSFKPLADYYRSKVSDMYLGVTWRCIL